MSITESRHSKKQLCLSYHILVPTSSDCSACLKLLYQSMIAILSICSASKATSLPSCTRNFVVMIHSVHSSPLSIKGL